MTAVDTLYVSTQVDRSYAVKTTECYSKIDSGFVILCCINDKKKNV